MTDTEEKKNEKQETKKHHSKSSTPEMVRTPYVLSFPQSPFVDCENKCIYFADVYASNAPSLFRYDFGSGILYGANVTNTKKANVIETASSGVPFKGSKDRFICNNNACFSHVKWDGKSTIAYKTDDIYCLGSGSGVFIDWGYTSPKGKYYFSIYQEAQCSGNETGLNEYDPRTGTITQRISGLDWTNGFYWDRQTKDFYLNNDCDNYATHVYRWNSKTGSMSKIKS